MTRRYYAEYLQGQESMHDGYAGWHVFDREITTTQGDTKPICHCVNRDQAFKIREALNKLDDA